MYLYRQSGTFDKDGETVGGRRKSIFASHGNDWMMILSKCGEKRWKNVSQVTNFSDKLMSVVDEGGVWQGKQGWFRRRSQVTNFSDELLEGVGSGLVWQGRWAWFRQIGDGEVAMIFFQM